MSKSRPQNAQRLRVAPFTGAWIEMSKGTVPTTAIAKVAPFTGAWIEM